MASGESLLEVQRALNNRSRGFWRDFEDHRRRLTSLARGARLRRDGRLCVLGAGNCNDLDLKALLEAFRDVHLVDLDRDALTWGIAQQGLGESTRLQVAASTDLAGLNVLLDGWTEADRGSRAGSLIEGLAAAAPDLPDGGFDVVLSSCLFSQLLSPVIDALGQDHERLPEALKALRRRHLDLLVGLLVPGGTALLVSDFVSSDSVPELAETPASEVKDLMVRLVEARNFFSGANPFALLSSLKDEPGLAAELDKVALVEPWLWHLGPRRSYLVYAIALRRKVGSS